MKKDKVILTDIYYIFNNKGSHILSDDDLNKLIRQQKMLKWVFVNYDSNICAYHFHKIGK